MILRSSKITKMNNQSENMSGMEATNMEASLQLMLQQFMLQIENKIESSHEVINNKIESSHEAIKNKIEISNEAIKVNNEEINKKLDESNKRLEEIEVMNKEIDKKLKNSTESLNRRLEGIEESAKMLETNLNERLILASNEINNKIDSTHDEINKLTESQDHLATELSERCNRNDTQILELSEKVDRIQINEVLSRVTVLERQVEKINPIVSENHPPVSQNVNTEMPLTPNVNIPNYLINELLLPSFCSEAGDQPVNFIKELDEYIRLRSISEDLKMLVVKKSLRGRALQWLNLIGGNITYSQFKSAFLSQYWNLDHQLHIRAEITNGKYDSRIDMNMIDYFLKMAEKAKLLNPPLSDKEFISSIINHFPQQTRNNLIVAKPSDYTQIIDLLTAFEDANKCRGKLENKINYCEVRDRPSYSNNKFHVEKRAQFYRNSQRDNFQERQDNRQRGRFSPPPRGTARNVGRYQDRPHYAPYQSRDRPHDRFQGRQVNHLQIHRNDHKGSYNSRFYFRPQNRESFESDRANHLTYAQNYQGNMSRREGSNLNPNAPNFSIENRSRSASPRHNRPSLNRNLN